MMPKPLAGIIVGIAALVLVIVMIRGLFKAEYDAVFRGSDAEWIIESNKPKPTPGDDLFNNVTRPLLLAGAGVAVVWAVVSLASAKPANRP